MKAVVSLALAVAVAQAATFTQTAGAADYPSKPIHVTIPFPPGGTTDLITRTLAPQMEPELKQPVVVENKPGAGGLLGVMSVARAEPDGYNVVVTGGSAIGPTFIKDSTIEMYRDLAPVSAFYEGVFVMVVQRSVPATNMAELVAYAKANPGKLNYGTTASNEKMLMEMFKRAAGVEIVEINYKGGAPRVAAMLANEVQLAIGASEMLNRPDLAAKVRAVIAFGPRAPSQHPGIPTAAQAGFPSLNAPSTAGMWAPQGTPADVITKLNRAVVPLLAMPANKAKILELSGFDAGGSTPEELRARSKAERDFYVQAATLMKLQPQ